VTFRVFRLPVPCQCHDVAYCISSEPSDEVKVVCRDGVEEKEGCDKKRSGGPGELEFIE
jgi:hypothetical protein